MTKIDEKTEFKIALQMSKSLSNEDSAYLTRNLVPVASLPEKQRLRLAKSKDVVLNKHKLESLGSRRFSVSGPKLWNNLPNSLKSSGSTKSFCRSMKTYLFNRSFSYHNSDSVFFFTQSLISSFHSILVFLL